MISPVESLDDLRALYPFIEEGMEAIGARRAGEYAIAADIYRLVGNGSLKAVVIHDDDETWGWATYHVANKALGYTHGFGDDLYIRSGAPAHLLDETFDYIEKACAAEGATIVSLQSTRLAWGRRLNKMGYSLDLYTFTKRL